MFFDFSHLSPDIVNDRNYNGWIFFKFHEAWRRALIHYIKHRNRLIMLGLQNAQFVTIQQSPLSKVFIYLLHVVLQSDLTFESNIPIPCLPWVWPFHFLGISISTIVTWFIAYSYSFCFLDLFLMAIHEPCILLNEQTLFFSAVSNTLDILMQWTMCVILASQASSLQWYVKVSLSLPILFMTIFSFYTWEFSLAHILKKRTYIRTTLWVPPEMHDDN